MKNLLSARSIGSLLFAALTALTISNLENAVAGGSKLFPSDIPGITIGNASYVSPSKKIIRGAAPATAKEITQLIENKVAAVIILREKPQKEVEKEVAALQAQGLKKNQIFQLPLHWDEKDTFQEGCTMVVNSLQVLVAAERGQGRAVFFHCTAGEDRTGLVAGLYRMLTQNWNSSDAFYKEMCANGYEAGDAGKPGNVVKAIRENLTPLYVKMARLIETKNLTPDHLDVRVCAQDPGEPQRIPVCSKNPSEGRSRF